MKRSGYRLIILLAALWTARASADDPANLSPDDIMRLLAEGRPAPAEQPDKTAVVAESQPAPEARSEPAAEAPPTNSVAAYRGPRDPFWPVGYVPRPAETAVEQEIKVVPTYRENWPSLSLRGIIRQGGTKNMAVLHPVGLVEEGELITIEKDGLVYRWIVERITGTEVSYSRVDARPRMNLQQKEGAE